mmetsp:Transcript_39170/g.91235  ORF Transcript_39170/g.91235 Transcript_39170/m.91235 type:complete len:283 (+) Transcript_39170:6560-7408(+)
MWRIPAREFVTTCLWRDAHHQQTTLRATFATFTVCTADALRQTQLPGKPGGGGWGGEGRLAIWWRATPGMSLVVSLRPAPSMSPHFARASLHATWCLRRSSTSMVSRVRRAHATQKASAAAPSAGDTPLPICTRTQTRSSAACVRTKPSVRSQHAARGRQASWTSSGGSPPNEAKSPSPSRTRRPTPRRCTRTRVPNPRPPCPSSRTSPLQKRSRSMIFFILEVLRVLSSRGSGCGWPAQEPLLGASGRSCGCAVRGTWCCPTTCSTWCLSGSSTPPRRLGP